MGSEDGEVYIMRDGDDGDWVSPVPAGEVIVDAVVDDSDLEEDDVGEIGSYVDRDELRAVLDSSNEDELEFEVEDVTVTVGSSGEITVE